MVRLFKQKYQYKKYTQKTSNKPWQNKTINNIIPIKGNGLYKINLYDILKNSYSETPDLSKYNFSIYKNLSNDNYQTYFNDDTKQLLFVVTGTHNLRDWGTDIKLALGSLKTSRRLQEAAKALQKAKNLLKPSETVLAGHSLGGAIAQYIASATDKVYTLNKGATLNQPTRSNETAYRTSGDIVSAFGTGIHTIKNPNWQIPGLSLWNMYKAHEIENIKNSNIII